MPALRSRSKTPSRGGAASSPERSSPRKAAPESSCCFIKCCPIKNTEMCHAVLQILVATVVIAGLICTTQHRCNFKLSSNAMADKLAFAFRCLAISGAAYASMIKYVCKFDFQISNSLFY